MKRILIATDGPPSADAAIAAGLKLAREQSADVVFAHVAGMLREARRPVLVVPSSEPAPAVNPQPAA
jgi:nucleotide-binding universal stress UspA family protein